MIYRIAITDDFFGHRLESTTQDTTESLEEVILNTVEHYASELSTNEECIEVLSVTIDGEEVDDERLINAHTTVLLAIQNDRREDGITVLPESVRTKQLPTMHNIGRHQWYGSIVTGMFGPYQFSAERADSPKEHGMHGSSILRLYVTIDSGPSPVLICSYDGIWIKEPEPEHLYYIDRLDSQLRKLAKPA